MSCFDSVVYEAEVAKEKTKLVDLSDKELSNIANDPKALIVPKRAAVALLRDRGYTTKEDFDRLKNS